MRSLAHFLRDVAHAITRVLVTDKVIDLDEARAIADAALAPDFIEPPDERDLNDLWAEAVAECHLTDEGIAAALREWSA